MRSVCARGSLTIAVGAVVLSVAGCAAATRDGAGAVHRTAEDRAAAERLSAGAAADAALQAQHNAFFAAIAARDAEAAAAFFADDAVLHVAGRPPVRGRAAIAGFYAGMFPFLSEATAAPETLAAAAAGDMAYGAGATTNRFSGPQGDVSYHGKYLLVWRRLDGAWRIVAYSISSDAG
jgi:uncharacterized protein (TIGR02246 family)